MTNEMTPAQETAYKLGRAGIPNSIDAVDCQAAWAYILGMIDPDDNTPLWGQVHRNYSHGGGWRDFKGFDIEAGGPKEAYRLRYPQDPPYWEISRLQREGERLVLFSYSWLLWTDGKETKIARID